MRKHLLIIAAFAALLATPALSQQMDGVNCDNAWKKLQQHVTNGVCQEGVADDRAADGTARSVGESDKDYAERLAGK